MTASKRQRTGDIDGTLRAMVEIVGNWRLDDALFERDDARFEGTFPTTWEHLVATDCLQQKSNWHYRLTPGGWIKGLEAAGRLRDEKTNGALGSLCASIKRRCEDGGLRHRTGVTIQELSEETDIPQGWISNVIDSHLIRICFQQVDCEWEPGDDNKNHVMIPARFGLEP
jgi:hypothetical protein